MAIKSENFFGAERALVAVLMGSDSDWNVMQGACEALDAFAIPYLAKVLSAHRTPVEMIQFAEKAAQAGYKILIAGAGGAAHLPGMLASATILPVIGVPVSTTLLQGQDSLLSIVQMPKGVPVATVAINGAYNAGVLAARILGNDHPDTRQKLLDFQKKIADDSRKKTLG
jgi:phosphoribosylaminoimidazole carboxylase PurE protein